MKTTQLAARQHRLFLSKTPIRGCRFKEGPVGRKKMFLLDATYTAHSYRSASAWSKTRNPKETAKWRACPESEKPFERRSSFDGFIARLRSYQWLVPYAGAEAKSVLDFCRQEGILSELVAAVRLAEKVFWSSDVKLEKDTDPETDATQVVISVSIRNKPRKEVLAAYYDFRKQLLNIVRAEKSHLIGLSYDIL